MDNKNSTRCIRRLMAFHLDYAAQALAHYNRVYVTDLLGVSTGRDFRVHNGLRVVPVPFVFGGTQQDFAFVLSKTLMPFDDVCWRNWLIGLHVTVSPNPSNGEIGIDKFGMYITTPVALPADGYVQPIADLATPIVYEAHSQFTV